MRYWDFMRDGGRPAKRDGIQKTIDYVAAYGGGPVKMGRFPSQALVMAAARTGFSAIERAIQTRIDEEGCGAFFAAAKYVTHPDTVSVDTCGARHGDINGDLGGDAVTFKSVRNKGCAPGAVDLGSGAARRGGSSPSTRTTTIQSSNTLK